MNSHGKIIRYISERDYLFPKAWELRFFASGWIVMYYGLAMHWWFPGATHVCLIGGERGDPLADESVIVD